MANQFFIWKDAECKGKDPVWIELSGEDFLRFIEQPENSHRRFVKEYFDEDNKSLGFYKFEVTEENFRKWDAKRKKNERSEDVLVANKKKKYLSEKENTDERIVNSIPTVVSFDAPITDDEETNFHDIVPDPNNDFERTEERILLEYLYEISQTLKEKDKRIAFSLYFNNKENKDDSQIAKELGISKWSICRKNEKIKKILKKIATEQ